MSEKRKKEDVIVLVPVYQERLRPVEKLALLSILHFCAFYPIALLVPEGLIIKESLCEGLPRLVMPSAYFRGIDGYNHLMMSEEFYAQLSNFTFCLIAQLDVLLLRDGLSDFLVTGADYLGAFEPYPLSDDVREFDRNVVWNGGLSLRRVEAFQKVLCDHSAEAASWPENEDRFFTWLGQTYPKEFRLAPPEECIRFARDRFWHFSERQSRGGIPFGIHAFMKLNPCAVRQLLCQQDMEEQRDSDLLRACERQKMKLQMMESFLQSEAEPLFLYGAGSWGKVAARYLHLRGIFVRGFIISDGKAAENPLSVEGLPVFEQSQFCQMYGSARILYCFSRKDADSAQRERARMMFPMEKDYTVFLMDYMIYEVMGDFVLCDGLDREETRGGKS